MLDGDSAINSWFIFPHLICPVLLHHWQKMKTRRNCTVSIQMQHQQGIRTWRQHILPSVKNPRGVLGLYRWSKSSWNRCNTFACYAILSPSRNTHTRHRAHYVTTWRYPQNRKLATYRNAARGPSHGYSQHAQNIWSSAVWRLRNASRQTDRQSHSSQHFARLPGTKW